MNSLPNRDQKIYEQLDPSLERSRNQTITGYDHPASLNNCNRDPRYKTFNEHGKAKKNEKFKGTDTGPSYAVYGQPPEDLSEMLCPLCSQKSPAVMTCPCVHNDMKCVAGHSWYMDRDGKIKVGDPHKRQ